MPIQLQERLEAFKEWTVFVSTLRQLNEAAWNANIAPGKWTIKDIVCHMMLWDKYFYEEAIHKIASGRQVTLKHLNFDEFNGKAVIYGRTIHTDELIEKAILYRSKIIDDIYSLSGEALERNYVDGDGNVFHIPTYLNDFIWHDQHHVVPMRKYLEECL